MISNFLHLNLYSPICIILFLFTRFDRSSSDEDEEEAAVARGVGKSNGDESDNDNYGDDEDDKDVQSIGKKSNKNTRLVGVSSIVGAHFVQTNNPQRDNGSSNFVGFTSHLALNYNPPLDPFCEYVVTFVQILIFKLYTNSYFFTTNSY
jgi:hypothetical protein